MLSLSLHNHRTDLVCWCVVALSYRVDSVQETAMKDKNWFSFSSNTFLCYPEKLNVKKKKRSHLHIKLMRIFTENINSSFKEMVNPLTVSQIHGGDSRVCFTARVKAASWHKRAGLLSSAILVLPIKSDYIRWLLWRLDSLLLPSLHYSEHVQQQQRWRRRQQQLGLAVAQRAGLGHWAGDATDTWSSGLWIAAREAFNAATSEAMLNSNRNWREPRQLWRLVQRLKGFEQWQKWSHQLPKQPTQKGGGAARLKINSFWVSKQKCPWKAH